MSNIEDRLGRAAEALGRHRRATPPPFDVVRRRRQRRRQLLGAAATVIALVVVGGAFALHGTNHDDVIVSTRPPTTHAPHASSSTTLGPITSTGVTLPTTTSPATTTTTTPPATSSGNGCASADLDATLTPAGSGAGNFFTEILFRNHAASTCEMTGYPGVSFLDASGAQIGMPAQRSGAAYQPVDLAPGGNAYVSFDIYDPDVQACPTATATFVRIYPPNETRPLLIKVDSSNASGAADGIRVCSAQVAPGTIEPVGNYAAYCEAAPSC